MSMKLGASSGTYNVQEIELARDNKTVKSIRCIVHFLDGTEGTFELDKRSRGQQLFDKVIEHLELVEKGYFGLQFADSHQSPDTVQLSDVAPDNNEPDGPSSRRWLDHMKIIKKQMRVNPPYRYLFRVKFYVCDPSKLQEEYTRYQFFLQLKKDICNGRLVVPHKTAVLLASYAVQSELGDYDPSEPQSEPQSNSYISESKFVPGQNSQFEKEVAELYTKHRGLTPAQAEATYLDRARRLEMYGIDVFKACWDQNNLDIQLGVSSAGLVVFQNHVRINTFSWAKIVKISFKRKQFFIQLRRDNGNIENETIDNLIGFNLASYRSCKNLWKSCVEHHTFFRLHTPQPPTKKSFFSLGSKFRYSGRTEFQTKEEVKRRPRVERAFSRSPSRNFARRTVGGTTRQVILEERNSIDGLRNQPHSPIGYNQESSNFNHLTSHPPGGPTDRGNSPRKQTRGLLSNSTSYPNSLLHHKSNQGLAPINNNDTTSNGSLHHNGSNMASVGAFTIGGSTASIGRPVVEKKRWGDHQQNDSSDGGFLSHVPTDKSMKPLTYADEDQPQYESTPHNEPYMANGSVYPDGHGLVTIKMHPDNSNKFGFNVKGGTDQGMPIIVSRVAPGSQADVCIPRLNEGDQVLYINGRDVSQHTHEQIVMFIRASREQHSRELVLVVRPNVYIGDDTPEEPDFSYIPDTVQLTNKLPPGTDPLTGSMILLEQALKSDVALNEFEQLYRKKPGMTMNISKAGDNVSKNRYRDISPYDQTRVVINNTSSDDYINANYVNMEIPGSGIVNCYIAAQGPLPNTCADFWQMVWEQQSRLVVMLTTKVERGRVKCHQYWPQLYETINHDHLEISCIKEQTTPSFAFREYTLVNSDAGNEERHIEQMQYTSWPDHGVPEESTDFLEFVQKVRQNRAGMVEPTIVHCSAGIGRTGVLITMETAMCLIEANQAVYPLDIVRQMRDQRAMLIQTPFQYKFVCEAILDVFKNKIVEPLDDYKR